MFGNRRQIFLRRCARNDRYRKNDFFRLGGGIFEGGKQNPSDFASDSGKILMNGGNAEASADICIVEAAEAEILRNAKTDRAAGEENQLGDTVVFGDDGGDAVAVHGKKLLLKRCAFCGKCGIIGKLLAAGDKLMRVRRDPGGFHFMLISGKAVAYR